MVPTHEANKLIPNETGSGKAAQGSLISHNNDNVKKDENALGLDYI